MLEDQPAGLGLPLPDLFDERLPAQVVPRQPLLGELALDDVLGGDAGMVHAGQPQRLVPLHPAPPDQCVHERVFERMPDVQRTGDVGWRYHDAERRPVAVVVGFEVAAFDPLLIQRRLHPRRFEYRRQRLGVRAGRLSHLAKFTERRCIALGEQ